MTTLLKLTPAIAKLMYRGKKFSTHSERLKMMEIANQTLNSKYLPNAFLANRYEGYKKWIPLGEFPNG